jgi:AAA15 family ATPase/GTPase
MLIQFTVGNYLSFKDKVTLSMEATSIKEHPENVFVTPDGRYRLLKSVAIYGANASGKSNLMKAMMKMSSFIRLGIQYTSITKLEVIPFKLSKETENTPSFFEIVFLIDNIKYRYGFEIDNDKVYSEWLFESKKEREKPLFIRENNIIEVFTAYKEGKGLEEKTGVNKLFLSVVDQFNGTVSKKILAGLTSGFNQFTALEHDQFSQINRLILGNKALRPTANKLFKNIGLGFQDFLLIPTDSSFNENELSTPDGFLKYFDKAANSNKILFEAKTIHNKYNDKNELIGQELFDMTNDESKGTNKIFNCTALILSYLQSSSTVAIDELDSSLHPLMTLAITKLFNSNENNPKNAQLIFTTHDTNLLSKGGFRRDQIYFVEKDNYEASHLYSLAEFKEPGGKKVRKDRSFEEDYIQGRYGAIPFIGDFSKLLSDGK